MQKETKHEKGILWNPYYKNWHFANGSGLWRNEPAQSDARLLNVNKPVTAWVEYPEPAKIKPAYSFEYKEEERQMYLEIGATAMFGVPSLLSGLEKTPSIVFPYQDEVTISVESVPIENQALELSVRNHDSESTLKGTNKQNESTLTEGQAHNLNPTASFTSRFESSTMKKIKFNDFIFEKEMLGKKILVFAEVSIFVEWNNPIGREESIMIITT